MLGKWQKRKICLSFLLIYFLLLVLHLELLYFGRWIGEGGLGIRCLLWFGLWGIWGWLCFLSSVVQRVGEFLWFHGCHLCLLGWIFFSLRIWEPLHSWGSSFAVPWCLSIICLLVSMQLTMWLAQMNESEENGHVW